MKFLAKLMLALLVFISLLGLLLLFPEDAQCNLESPLIKDETMPGEWSKVWTVLPPALPKMGAQDAISIVYENRNELAHHTIYQYKNRALAFLSTKINDQAYFSSSGWMWSNMVGSDSWKLTGSVIKIQCGDSTDPLLGHRCSALILYGPFVSNFSSSVGEGVLERDEFKEIVVSIDEAFVSCLK